MTQSSHIVTVSRPLAPEILGIVTLWPKSVTLSRHFVTTSIIVVTTGMDIASQLLHVVTLHRDIAP